MRAGTINWRPCVLLLCLIMMIGCTSDEPVTMDDESIENDHSTNDEDSTGDPWAYDGEPATVKMLIQVGDEEFNRRFKEQVEAEFPEITLELIQGSPPDLNFLQELYASGEIPDIITVNPTRELVVELDSLEPIDDYIEQSGFDLSIFREGVVENLRSRDPMGEGHLYGLPIESIIITMFYNKDIFDLMGEPYPVDGMTWDETLELAKRMTVERDGIQYKGLLLSRSHAIPYTQLGVPSTDPETGEVLFAQHPDTKRFFDLLDELRNIPGIMETDPENPDGFSTDAQNIAMWINNAPHLPLIDKIEGFNFDMVSTPTWEHLPHVAPTSVALSFNIVKHSENKDAAWSVIAYLASEEAQTVLSGAGSPPTIDSEAAYEAFGSLDEDLTERFHVNAPFLDQYGQMAPYSPFGPEITFHGEDFISMKAREFMTSELDVVTYLREMEEEYAAIVEDIKAQK